MAFCDPREVMKNIPMQEGMRVADFGAGSGFYTYLAAERVGESGQVFAIDIQEELLETIADESEKAGHTNVKVIRADLEVPDSTGIKGASIDVVLLSNTLFQIEKKSVTLSEAKRILKEKGRLILIDWGDSFGGLGPDNEAVLERETAKELCIAGGFTFEREIDVGDCHFGFLFKK